MPHASLHTMLGMSCRYLGSNLELMRTRTEEETRESEQFLPQQQSEVPSQEDW